MSSVREVNSVCAILIADLHLWLKAPLFREAEPCWWAAQERVLDQVFSLAEKHNTPVVCAGDVFDRWYAPAELINRVIHAFRKPVYSVAGNHDLPNHVLSDMKRSAYWTLVEAGVLRHLTCGKPEYLESAILWGFSNGEKIIPCPEGNKSPFGIHLAVVHQYCWQPGSSYPGAPEEGNVKNLRKHLAGYSAATFGDNHKGFLSSGSDKFPILNCGTLLRRKSDEVDYIPCVGLLFTDGTIERSPLDCSKDVVSERIKIVKSSETNLASGVVEELNSIGEGELDFIQVLNQRLKREDVSQQTRTFVLGCVDGK